jgi:putrescine aminotransferase
MVATAPPKEAPRKPRLAVSSEDVLNGLPRQMVLEAEKAHGNGDLIRIFEILGVAGPFRVLTPWELEDETGRHLIGAGGYAALPFGERYGPLIRFVETFLEQSRSTGLPQQSASAWRAALEASLVGLLAEAAPSHAGSRVFFSNSGAGAIEAAVKFVRAARPGARYLITFTRGYHGKTMGALSLTPNEESQRPFRPLLPNIVVVPYGDARALKATVKRLGPKNVAGIILEAIQGEAGVIAPPEGFLPAVEALRQRYGMLVIADEVQTGLGRSGHLFASVAAGLDPDVVTLAKPLGGGLVAIGATIAREWIVKKALGGIQAKRHSNTFGGGSLAMAVGLRSLEIIVEEDLAGRARVLGEAGRRRLEGFSARYPGLVEESRAAGMLFALQLKPLLPTAALSLVERIIPAYNVALRPLVKGPELPANVLNQLSGALAVRGFHQAGVHACFSLNAGRTVRLTPALTIPEPLFEAMFDRIESALEAYGNIYGVVTRSPRKVVGDLVRFALFG